MAFETGAMVRAEFTGTVITAGGSRDGTSKVRGPDGRIHLLHLSNDASRRALLANAGDFTRQPSYGATVRVKFTGKVVPGTDADGTQPVRAAVTYFFAEYLNPDSGYVQLASGAPPALGAGPAIVPSGTKLDVSFAGTVVSRETGAYSTSLVRETGTGREHSLFLNEPIARGQLTGSRMDLPKGATARFSFTATAADGTTLGDPRRRVTTSDGISSWTHLLDTGSPSVTVHVLAEPGDDIAGALASLAGAVVQGAEKKEPEPAAAQAPAAGSAKWPAGTRFRAEFGAVVTGREDGPALTSRVREAGTGREHSLYLPARSDLGLPRSAGTAPGSVIQVSFEGSVVSDLEVRARRAGPGLQRVKGSGAGYWHYLDLSSPSVTRLDADGTAAGLPAEAGPQRRDALLAAARAELAKRTSFRGDEVRDEIEALAAGLLTWAARRVRNAEVVQRGFTDKTEAESWIEDNDYDPRRVEAVQMETGDPPPELAALRELDKLGESVTEDWEGGDEVVRGDQFDAFYAQGQFREDLESQYGASGVDLEEWPLNLIDWDDAAAALRKDRESFEWAGQTWYSKD